jgi:hypothetical protein
MERIFSPFRVGTLSLSVALSVAADIPLNQSDELVLSQAQRKAPYLDSHVIDAGKCRKNLRR